MNDMSMRTNKRTSMELPRRRRRTGPSRAEQAEETRRRLFHAAARIVGIDGYAAASVARITAEAGVAQGTFYNYFDSRQDMLNQLLPALGQEIGGYLRSRVRGSRSAIEREERQLRGYFEFLNKRPEFQRILHEAEFYAPEGYRQHFKNVESQFVAALRRDWERGELPDYEEQDLAVVGYVMMAARDYLIIRYGRKNGKVTPIPEHAVRAYMKVVTHGVFGPPVQTRK